MRGSVETFTLLSREVTGAAQVDAAPAGLSCADTGHRASVCSTVHEHLCLLRLLRELRARGPRRGLAHHSGLLPAPAVCSPGVWGSVLSAVGPVHLRPLPTPQYPVTCWLGQRYSQAVLLQSGCLCAPVLGGLGGCALDFSCSIFNLITFLQGYLNGK